MLIKKRVFYIIMDFAAIVFSYLLTMLAKYASFQPSEFLTGNWYGLILVIFSYLIVILFFQLDPPLMERDLWKEFKYVFLENMYMALVLSLLLYLIKMGGQTSRTFFILYFIFDYFCMYLGRVYCKYILISYYQRPERRRRLLIFASRDNALAVMHIFTKFKYYNCDAVALAIVETNPGEMTETAFELNLIRRSERGSYMVVSQDDIAEFLKKQVVDEALISLQDADKGFLNGLIGRLENLGIVVHVTVDTFGLTEHEKVIDRFGNYRVLTYCFRVFEPAELAAKRLMDIAGGIIGLVLTVLLSVFVAPAIYIESPGPVIFKQVRIGKNGRRFYIYKFRSMYMDAEERKKELMSQNKMNGLMFKVKDDPRITKVGKFIRKASIDEFPQFFNVLKGDMSLVGTRPPTVDEFLKYEEHHKRRLSLKPGITGLWQVAGRSAIIDFEDVVRLDLKYIDNWSIWSDLKILVQTVVVVVFHKGAE